MTEFESQSEDSRESLKGTTLRVYRYIFKAGEPIRTGEIQRDLGLSSISVAQYHVKKLLQLGLVKEVQEGYIIDRVVFDNVIRFKRLAIPTQVAYIAFFLTSLLVMLIFLRPATISPLFVFALAVISAAVVTSAYEALKTLKSLK